MSLLSVVQGVCAVVGVPIPAAVFPGIAGNRTMQEMVALANEMAQRIAYDTRDWRTLLAANFFLGTVAPDYANGGSYVALPDNFKRLMLMSNIRRSGSPGEVMRFIASLDEWSDRIANNVVEGNGEWIIYNDRIYVRPQMADTETIHFVYLDKNCVKLTSGGYGDHFMADADSFRLDERLLKLGMVWQWKANKGSPYAEDMGTYSDAIANAMGHDQPAPIIIDGRRRGGPNAVVDTSWSWPLGGGMVPP